MRRNEPRKGMKLKFRALRALCSPGRAVAWSAFFALLLVAGAALAQQAPSADPFGTQIEYRRLFGEDSAFRALNPRIIIWIFAQLHLLFAAFVLAVPMFVVIIELVGHFTKDHEQSKK